MLIDQRTVYAEGGDGDPADTAIGQLRGEPLTAAGEALQNGFQRPLMPDTVLRGNITGVGRRGAGDNFSLTVNGYGPHVGRATVEDQDNLLFHNCSWEITYCRMAASPYPAYKTVRFVGLIRRVSATIRQLLDV